MIIGRVTEIDTAKRSCTVLAYGREDDFVLRDVHILNTTGQMSSTPQIGDQVLVNNDGGESFLMGSLPIISENEIADRATQEMLPGDCCMGTREQGVGLFRGGLVFLLANPATGVIAVDQLDGILNLLGNSIYIDSTLYHKEIITEESGVKTVEKLSGSETTIETKENTVDGEIETTIKGLAKLTINVNQEPVKPTDSVIIAEVAVNFKTELGNIKLTISKSGDVTLEGIKDMVVKAERVAINTEFDDPLNGLVTGHTTCPYTQGPHIGCSKSVFAGG